MFIILNEEKGYGRLFESVKEAEIWQERYSIDGIIVEWVNKHEIKVAGRSSDGSTD